MERLLEARAPQRRISLGLERIHHALDYFGRPDRRYPAVIVSGTKGKGSTSAFIARSLQALNLRTGLYTSPHLQCIGERITLDGVMISPSRLRSLIEETLRAMNAGKIPELSYFEILTLIAARYFAEEKADFVVWEVGIGGRLDATNAFARIGAITTSISLDHTDILGTGLRNITREKLAIHEPANLRIIGNQTTAVRRYLPDFIPLDSIWLYGRDFSAVLQSTGTTGSTFTYWGGDNARDATVRQPGDYQVDNAATALAFIQCWLSNKIPRVVLEALSTAFWPGRMEIVSRENALIVLDGAHNPYSVLVLRRNLQRLFHEARWTILFSCQTTKDFARMIHTLSGIAKEFIFTVAPGALRPADPYALSAVCPIASRVLSFYEAVSMLNLFPSPDFARHKSRHTESSIREPDKNGRKNRSSPSQDLISDPTIARPTTPILVTGSLYLVGAVRTPLGLPPLMRSN